MASKRGGQSTKAELAGFAAKCEEYGYDPADAILTAMKAGHTKCADLMDYAEKGTPHPDYPGNSPGGLKLIAIKEMADLLAMDIQLLPYRYGKIQSVQPPGDDGKPAVNRIEVVFGAGDNE